ncbi:MAG: ATP-grasp domain-containing protein [Myxococcales bacterium]|nr:ATP-grasp domain-containing protein [Myxococcales bacterium]
MKPTGAPALVLDGAQPAALAVVRSLGRRGVPCLVGHAGPELPLAARSRYAVGLWRHPDPALDREAFVAALAARLAASPVAAVVPVTDWSLVPIAEDRARLGALAPLVIPPAQPLAVTLSKGRTAQMAQAAGVPIPPTVAVGPEDPDPDLRRLSPGVVKPDQSKAWAGALGRHRAVIPYETPAEGARALARLRPLGPVVVQARVPGAGVGVGVFAVAGELKFAFQYRRLHEVPLSGGGSSLRVGEPLDPTLARDAAALVATLGWDGAAMLEYKVAPDGRRWLIEINGRFWGALPLATASGADFPWAWFAHVTGRPWTTPRPTPGLRARELTRDLEWFKQAARALPARQTAAELGRLLRGREAWDTLTRDDPAPALETAGQVLHDLAGLPLRRLRRQALRRAQARLRAHPPRLAHVRRVVFVCEGNIIRSALAEALARQAAPERAWASAGLAAWPGRPAHPTVVAHHPPLGTHRARAVSQVPRQPGDLWIAMTFSQLERLEGPAHLLGVYGGPALEVTDPDGAPADAFPPVLAAVEAGVAGLLAALARSSR